MRVAVRCDLGRRLYFPGKIAAKSGVCPVQTVGQVGIEPTTKGL